MAAPPLSTSTGRVVPHQDGCPTLIQLNGESCPSPRWPTTPPPSVDHPPTHLSVSVSPIPSSWTQSCTTIRRRDPCDLSALSGPCVVLYELVDFEGLSLTLHDAETDLAARAFANATASLMVSGAPWRCCAAPDCAGEAVEVFEEGCYPDLGSFSRLITAAWPVRQSLEDPAIRVYTDTGLAGTQRNFSREVNLAYSDVDNQVSSHEVQAGAWVLSSDGGNRGRKRLALQGQVLDYSAYGPGSFNDVLSHLCPLMQGRPVVVGVRLDCAQAQSTVGREVLDVLLVSNVSPLEQLLTVTHGVGSELGVSETFTFSRHTVLRQGVTFGVSVHHFHWGFFATLSSELRLDLEHGFQVEKGVTESWSRQVAREVEVRARVPPNATVIATILLQEKTYVVPVVLSVRLGFQVVEERANFTCVDRTCTTVEYEVQD
ncbi:epidermal differentiation-specific protein-like [Chiloscyllium plagiosum]|uniref:epidermal differentiation-specific protein-like n=1 Tax=Chiloscyllium plagiosum TaxID=36176 RepID=UPI001CB87D07|nr:epidermal differentiation-specific protein-like [Chiloscyllium plagiosum]